ncbi:hypothetical protein EDB85DRAFT_2203032 [Lactarius pseudohatsudake]|nr:hypothetical protein EDB85DRAFT_2203032 [Lactarius pseudohatsudake]
MPKVASSGPGPTKRSSAAGKKPCTICGGHFRPQVFAAHFKKCEREKREEEGLLEYKKDMLNQARAKLGVPGGLRTAIGTLPAYEHSIAAELDTQLDITAPCPLDEPAAVPNSATHRAIRMEYHPNSRRPTKVHGVDDPSHAPRRTSTRQPYSEPWSPFFQTREDFLLAEIFLQSGLGNEYSDRILKVFDLCNAGKGKVTLSKISEVHTAWERASLKLTPFESSTVSVSYNDKELKFDVYHRALWDWATDLVQSSQLATHFHWDAEKIFQCDEGSSVRVFNEPWSADAFWDAQSQIPEGGKPLGLILYADKTRLSSFATEEGYPVPEDPMGHKKPSFVNFKRTIWHESFSMIVQSIVTHSKTGCWLECGDGVERWLFPIVLILSADYEEQTGPAGRLPTHKKSFSRPKALRCARDCEALLSKFGLRNVQNVFWQLQHTDPHRALSFDRLHSNNTGVFGYHLWEVFKEHVEGYGRQAGGAGGRSGVMKISFTDGTKFEDISKILIFAAHNIIPWERSEQVGKSLLCALRSFTIVDLFLSFEEHTEHTIAVGRQELHKFGQPYTDDAKAQPEAKLKNWNFPKMHAAGASRNYNTKPNEKLHGPLKKTYARQTNFKNVTPQILRVEHAKFVSILIRDHIDELDVASRESVADETSHETVADEVTDDPIPNQETLSTPTLSVIQGGSVSEQQGKVFYDGHIVLHSRQPPAILSSIGNTFHRRLAAWLTAELTAAAADTPGPLPRAVVLSPDDLITEYQSIKVVYESRVDQKQYIDRLHCNPRFHGNEWRDFIMVLTTHGHFFAQLLLVFTVSVTNVVYSVCLVRPLNAPISTQRIKDRELGLRCVRARRDVTEFIFARTIIRGAPLIRDFDKEGYYYVMDVVDHTGDLFLRCNEECASHLFTPCKHPKKPPRQVTQSDVIAPSSLPIRSKGRINLFSIHSKPRRVTRHIKNPSSKNTRPESEGVQELSEISGDLGIMLVTCLAISPFGGWFTSFCSFMFGTDISLLTLMTQYYG